ncbi:MAG: DUF2207 domain-containing protein [Actinomycetia bacterium]|nr:DUF2207 domain-containing protein [Actinomycetes bacterium]
MRRRRLRSLALPAIACAVLAFLAVLAGPAGSAMAKDWRIDNMDVLLDVQENGDVIVDETVTFTFEGNFRNVARDIPTTNTGGITDIEVRDANGVALPKGDTPGTFNTFKEGDTLYIQMNFDLTDTSATWTIHYRARTVVMFFDEGDELRWYVFDASTPVPIGAVKATVKLPGSVPSAQMTQAVQAGYGVETSVTSPGPSTMVYEAADIPPYTNFWIVTGFPKGVVKYTWTGQRVAEFVVPKIGFVLPIGFFLGMLLIWRRRGRDEPAAVYARYVSEPPSDLSPGLAGALIDEKVDTKEVIATIIDLARRGYLEITDTDKNGPARKTLTIFTRRKPLDDLQGFERKVAEALFDAKHPDQVTTDELKNHFYTHIEPIVSRVYAEVAERRLFHSNPKKARARWVGYGFVVAVILGVLTAIMALAGLTGWGWFMLGSIVSVLIVWAFAPHMPQRTPTGAQEQRKWEAFRNYLKDLTRFQDMASAKESFEKYLPYAIAFGVEKEWVRRFEGLTVPSPDWYHPPVIVYGPGTGGWIGTGGAGGGLSPAGGPSGPVLPGGSGGGFSLDTISDGLFKSLGNMSSVLTAVPGSSGGSKKGAFGGGGFSGGGFGGGFSGGGGGGGFRAG